MQDPGAEGEGEADFQKQSRYQLAFHEHTLCAGHCAGAGLSDEDMCYGSAFGGVDVLETEFSCQLLCQWCLKSQSL